MNHIYRKVISNFYSLVPVKDVIEKSYFDLFSTTIFKAFQIAKDEFYKARGHEIVYLSKKELKSGFELMRKKLIEAISEASIAASFTALAGGWLAVKGYSFLDAPLTALAATVSGGIACDSALQAWYIKRSVSLSVLSGTNPACLTAVNENIEKIIAGNNARVKMTIQGLKIWGPYGDIQNLIQARKKTITDIQQMNKIIVPRCALNKEAVSLIEAVNARWLATFSIPFAAISLFSFANKGSKNRGFNDYMTLLPSSYILWNYFSPYLRKKDEENLSAYLSQAENAQEAIDLLIDPFYLENGMSFLRYWTDAKDLFVKIGKDGNLSLHKKREDFPIFSEPFPIRSFANKESFKEENNEKKWIYGATVSSVFALALLLKKKKKSPED